MMGYRFCNKELVVGLLKTVLVLLVFSSCSFDNVAVTGFVVVVVVPQRCTIGRSSPVSPSASALEAVFEFHVEGLRSPSRPNDDGTNDPMVVSDCFRVCTLTINDDDNGDDNNIDKHKGGQQHQDIGDNVCRMLNNHDNNNDLLTFEILSLNTETLVWLEATCDLTCTKATLKSRSSIDGGSDRSDGSGCGGDSPLLKTRRRRRQKIIMVDPKMNDPAPIIQSIIVNENGDRVYKASGGVGQEIILLSFTSGEVVASVRIIDTRTS